MPRPVEMYTGLSRKWIIPLNFVFSFGWALELVTHLEELAFWLYLLHQNPDKGEWFDSWEYRLWYCGSIIAIIGMPLTCMITRRDLETVDAYIFLSGSAGSLCTTVVFLYVLWWFPNFIRHVKSEGADPSVVVRLATFLQLNLARVVFRFLFTIPLLMLALDGIIGHSHPLNANMFSADFLFMIGGIGCFVSSAITLLIFFPRSIIREEGYKPKQSSTIPNTPKSTPVTPLPSMSAPFSVASSHFPRPVISPSHWDGESALASMPDESTLEVDLIQSYHLHLDEEAEGDDHDESQAPPYHSRSQSHPVTHTRSETGVSHAHSPSQAQAQLHQRHPFPHSLSSPQILSPPSSPAVRVTVPPPARLPHFGFAQEQGLGRAPTVQGWLEDPAPRAQRRFSVPRGTARPSSSVVAQRQHQHHRAASASRLHPYVMTFTSPIDLVDLSTPEEFDTSPT
ncbi:uncharacterized protein FIBRA_03070 [Fibroporia radiculosa]|uniref:Transmembrane protein n=1 Tax=Fibroporia radiculosa TaxID=599839 RepID=J4HVS5_9APHY|nr:uncharacterized protein FIBRA_03070 [Fibroporia radiculosa]CCM01022.1 predicted protein [Fibroporia radiculosa]